MQYSDYCVVAKRAIASSRLNADVQSYLLSIRPFLTPKATAAPREGDVEEEQQTRSKIVSAEDDAVYHWGRDLEVDWKMVTYVTLRDQVSRTWKSVVIVPERFWKLGGLWCFGVSRHFLKRWSTRVLGEHGAVK